MSDENVLIFPVSPLAVSDAIPRWCFPISLRIPASMPTHFHKMAFLYPLPEDSLTPLRQVRQTTKSERMLMEYPVLDYPKLPDNSKAPGFPVWKNIRFSRLHVPESPFSQVQLPSHRHLLRDFAKGWPYPNIPVFVTLRFFYPWSIRFPLTAGSFFRSSLLLKCSALCCCPVPPQWLQKIPVLLSIPDNLLPDKGLHPHHNEPCLNLFPWSYKRCHWPPLRLLPCFGNSYAVRSSDTDCPLSYKSHIFP